MPSVERLKQRLARTLKARKLDGALATISALTQLEPHDPIWPRRAARLLGATDDVDGQLTALRRALALQTEQGLMLDAIASCRAILEIAPDDDQTLDLLDLLHLNSADPMPRSGRRNRSTDSRERTDAPLDSLMLTDVVSGAHPVQIADAEPGWINEIPVDETNRLDRSPDDILDLRLEDLNESSVENVATLAAAQVASLPDPTAQKSCAASTSDRGFSLRAELANVPLFGDLDPASLHTLIRRVRVVQLDAGQVLFREGDPANSLYVVVEGAVVPIAEGERRQKLAVLERGEFFGEIGVMAKQPRNATIEALVETKLLAIDRRVLWELIDDAPSVAKSILRFLRARLIDRQIRTNLFFAAFANAEREAVARQFRILEVRDETRIVEQGRPPEGLFVVLSGSLEVRDVDADKVVGHLGQGDVFGGLSLIEGRPAPAAIVARGKCWLVVLGEARFRRILEANPSLDRILRRLAKAESGAHRNAAAAGRRAL